MFDQLMEIPSEKDQIIKRYPKCEEFFAVYKKLIEYPLCPITTNEEAITNF